MSKKGLLSWGLGMLFISALGQDARYFIYLKDKGKSTNPYSLEKPEAFVTAKSIDRRKRQQISWDSTDLPVNPNYIEAVSALGIDVFFSSKWLNGLLVEASTTEINEANNLSFVSNSEILAEGTRLEGGGVPPEDPDSFEPPTRISSTARSTDFQLRMLNANRMHEDGFDGEGITIAILDNGFRGVNRYEPFQSIWEENRLIATKDFVQNTGNVFQFGGHGSQVLSVIAADYQNDSVLFKGIATKATYILCITEDTRGENRIEEINWVLGAEFADSLGADIINSSLGYTTFDMKIHNYKYADMDGSTTLVTRAAHLASKKGILVVNSAGNSGNKSWKYLSAPADAEGILSVGSVDVDFSKSSFSSFGPTADGRLKPSVSAFGNGTVVVNGSGQVTNSPGTSFSTPLIAGFAAGIWQMNPNWTKDELIQNISKSGHLSDNPNNEVGYGVPNYTYIANGRSLHVEDIFEDKIVIYPNPFHGDTLFISADKSFKGNFSVKILNPQGKTIYAENFRKRDLKKELELTIDSSQSGVYYLFLQSGKNKKVVKLINYR